MSVVIDETRVEAFVNRIVDEIGAAVSVPLTVIGARLGLYAAMADGEPVTPAELARRTRTYERYIREWLAAQAAGGYVEYDAATGTYALPIEHARANAAAAGVDDRVRFEIASATNFPGEGYDLVACFDSLHDLGDPAAAAAHVRSALAPNGTWLIVEPQAGDTVEENLHLLGASATRSPRSSARPARSRSRGAPGSGRWPVRPACPPPSAPAASLRCAARPRRRSTWCSRPARNQPTSSAVTSSGSRRRARS